MSLNLYIVDIANVEIIYEGHSGNGIYTSQEYHATNWDETDYRIGTRFGSRLQRLRRRSGVSKKEKTTYCRCRRPTINRRGHWA
ncbi:hypothetical protein HZ326_16124 [Fusarium oxysporum f. sp. albedinis]|nr:hypothetical protein HZ326_16124 [Fusarium oxysporum f. sp. albedinis]